MTPRVEPPAQRRDLDAGNPPPSASLVSLADVSAAARRLAGVALRTPLVAFDQALHTGLAVEAGAGRAWLKAENLQTIGAFKIRGAYNALAQLGAEERARGVVTHSSGNHAQGVSRAARLLGIRAVVVMPRDAPRVKVAGVRADGAEIDVVGPDSEERVSRAHELAEREGLVLVPSYDDERIVAGQGTVGLEVVRQIRMRQVGRSTGGGRCADGPPTILVPIGGGGLSSGICVAVKGLWPEARVIGVEPELAADARDSLRAGHVVRWDPALTGRTVADGVRTSAIGHITFAHLHALLDGMLTVDEQEIARAMFRAARFARLVVEPSGAVSIAALLFRTAELAAPGPLVAVVSGGNVDGAVYRRLLAEGEAADGTQVPDRV